MKILRVIRGERIAGLLLSLLFLCGNAAAQTFTCTNDPAPGHRIVCEVPTNGANIDIDLDGVTISGTFPPSPAVAGLVNAGNTASLDIVVRDSTISAGGAFQAIAVSAIHAGAGDIEVEVHGTTITTTGISGNYGVYGEYQSTATAANTIRLVVRDSTLTTSGNAVYADNSSAGAIDVEVSGSTITTSGDDVFGIYALHRAAGDDNTVHVVSRDVTIMTSGGDAHAILGTHNDNGDVDIDVHRGAITTTGLQAHGVRGVHDTEAGDVSIGVMGSSISTEGVEAHAVSALHDGEGVIDVDLEGSAVTTTGVEAYGVLADHRGTGDVDVSVMGSSVSVTGDNSHGVSSIHSGTGDIHIGVTGESVLSASGANAHGVRASYFFATSDDNGEIRVTVGEGASVTGGVDGINVSGAGLDDMGTMDDASDDLRKHYVAVRGTVTGGTGAAVHMSGGGMVTIGPRGEIIAGSSGVAILVNDPGDLEVVVEVRNGRSGNIQGEIENQGGDIKYFVSRDGGEPEQVELEEFLANLGLEGAGGNRIYEALPSVLLDLNGLATFDDRVAAAQSGRGGWIGIGGTNGTWSADESTAEDLEYDLDRWVIRGGVEKAVSESTAVGIAAHHVRGDADVDEGGAVDATGTGLTLSARWVSENGAYVIGQLARTWYDVDLSSSTDGELRDGVDATGLALGIEFGRRWERGDWLWTPRASVVRSSVSVDDFTDLGDTRVSVEDGMSVTASMGVRVESESGLFGSVDVEHELSGDREVTVSGTRLESEAESTRLRLNVGGARSWDEGRYEVNGRIGYATSGDSHEFNGNLTLEMRF